jgi:hypothetical protein
VPLGVRALVGVNENWKRLLMLHLLRPSLAAVSP